MASNFRLERVKADNKWDTFLSKSQNSSVLFSLSNYLKAIKHPYGCYFVYNNNELRSAISVFESQDEKSTKLHDFGIYNGVIFGPRIKEKNQSKNLSERFRITNFIAHKLIEIYDRVEISLDPSVIDIRPFQWVNYGSKSPKYDIDIRYTSYVNIQSLKTAEDFEYSSTYIDVSKTRRQEIRYAIRHEIETFEEFNIDTFIEFYGMTMNRQQKQVSNTKLNEMYSVLNQLHAHQLGRMFCSYTSDGKLGSMAFFATDHLRAYYLFGANNPELRNKYTGTAVIWDAFRKLSANGIKEVDMEGVNSPNRGWFKLSFGGDIRPYYHIKYSGFN